MKKCPCCDKQSLNEDMVMNSISHIDNKTHICNDCGQKESFVHLADSNLFDEIDVEIYARFKARLGK